MVMAHPALACPSARTGILQLPPSENCDSHTAQSHRARLFVVSWHVLTCPDMSWHVLAIGEPASILWGFLSGCHCRRSSRHSFILASFGSTVLGETASIISSCPLANFGNGLLPDYIDLRRGEMNRLLICLHLSRVHLSMPTSNLPSS